MFYDWGFASGPDPTAFYVPAEPGDTMFTLTVTDAFGCTASNDALIDASYCLSVDDVVEAAQMRIYPNPAQEAVWIAFDLIANVQQLQVTDALGRFVAATPVWASSNRCRINGLRPGIYLVTAVVNDKLQHQTLVIQQP